MLCKPFSKTLPEGILEVVQSELARSIPGLDTIVIVNLTNHDIYFHAASDYASLTLLKAQGVHFWFTEDAPYRLKDGLKFTPYETPAVAAKAEVFIPTTTGHFEDFEELRKDPERAVIFYYEKELGERYNPFASIYGDM